MPTLRVLYVFAGVFRKCDVEAFLMVLCKKLGILLIMKNIDLKRDKSHDVTSQPFWQEIMTGLEAKEFDVLIITPPCNEWSRAKFSSHPGPKPGRTKQWPRGFPWLSPKQRPRITESNYFIDITIESCIKAHSANIPFLIEHPEDLGMTYSGFAPASIWQLPEIRQLAQTTSACTAALFQCDFTANTSKPTRLLSTLANFMNMPHTWAGWPKFSPESKYLGPLPAKCSHSRHEALIGHDAAGTGFKTEPASAYPGPMCLALAERVVEDFLLRTPSPKGEGAPPLVPAETALAPKPCLLPPPAPEVLPSKRKDMEGSGSESSSEEGDKAAEVEATSSEDEFGQKRSAIVSTPGGWGPPLRTGEEWRRRDFHDGAGLCSPGRWHPARRLHQSDDTIAFKLLQLIRKHLNGMDVPKTVYQLASAKFTASPFSSEIMDAFRKDWAILVGGHRYEKFLGVPARQPFFLPLVSETLKLMGDPDYMFFSSKKNGLASGTTVGMGEHMPRTPQVFERKNRWKKYDDSVYTAHLLNYASAADLSEVLERQFEEELDLGMMVKMKVAAAKDKYPDLRISAQGAIDKGDGTYRVIHDATHGTQINNAIRPRDQTRMPGPRELQELLMINKEEAHGVHFGLQADVKKAHRRCKIVESQWGLLACQSDNKSDSLWLNCVGTFGVSSAAYYWTRAAAGLARLCVRLWGREHAWQLIYADDLHWIAHGRNKLFLLLASLFIWEAAGTPFSWKKTRGGLTQDWVGFWIDYNRFAVGISEGRCRWLSENIIEILNDKMVLIRRLHELLGRLGFAAQLLRWGKPFLAPVYAWVAATPQGACLSIPLTVHMSLDWLLRRLVKGQRFVFCERSVVSRGEVFCTDASATDELIVIGGWRNEGNTPTSSAEWFSETLDSHTDGWLFVRGSGKRAIAAAELLGTAVALKLWTKETEGKSQRISLSGRTDNQGNQYMARRHSTTSFPAAPVLMAIAEVLEDRNLDFDLKWRRRNENTEADALTNQDFALFDPAKRIRVCVTTMFPLIQAMAQHQQEFRKILAERKLEKKSRRKLVHRKKARTAKTVWA